MAPQTRFFGPLLGNDQHIRVSDAERQQVADRLAVHYGDGRLDHAEFDERVSRAMTAKTRGDLRGLFDDLPEPGPAGAHGTVAGTRPGTVTGPRRRHRHPVPLLVLLVCAAAVAAHAVVWFAVPGLFLGLALVAALSAAGHLRHRAR